MLRASAAVALASRRRSGAALVEAACARLKARLHLLTALCDLGGVWDLDQVTGALTRFADAGACARRCRCAVSVEADRVAADRLRADKPDARASSSSPWARWAASSSTTPATSTSRSSSSPTPCRCSRASSRRPSPTRAHPGDRRHPAGPHRRGLCLPRRPATAARSARPPRRRSRSTRRWNTTRASARTGSARR